MSASIISAPAPQRGRAAPDLTRGLRTFSPAGGPSRKPNGLYSRYCRVHKSTMLPCLRRVVTHTQATPLLILRLLSSSTMANARRLPPMKPPHLDDAQQELFDNIVQSRIQVVGKEALFDEDGGLRGPWNPEVASPQLGKHLERLATAVRTENSLEPRLYEIAILVVGVHWQAQVGPPLSTVTSPAALIRHSHRTLIV